MPAITLTDLTFSYTAESLLDGVSFTVVNGERACLIGPNGCGKSTLLALVTGDLAPTRGTAEITGVEGGAAGLRRAPDVLAMTGTVGDYLDAATAPVRALSTRFDEVNAALAQGPAPTEERRLAREFDSLLAHMEAADVWSLDARIETTLAGLDLAVLAGQEGKARGLATLSPGQRGRLELAATLLASPSVLVLDEPTNHLDAEAAHYLSELLRAFNGPILFASHDRAFIDETATVLFDLDTAPWQALLTATGQAPLAGVQRCAGGYADYLERKAKARAGHAEFHAAQQEEKKSIRAHRRSAEDIKKGGVRLKEATPFQRKFFADRASKTMTRRTRNDDRKMEALESREVRKPREYLLSMDLPPVGEASGAVAVAIRNAAVPGRLARVTLDVCAGEHLLLTGANGAGKSTLLRWIATGSAPTVDSTGTVDLGGRLALVPQRLPQPGDPGLDAETWESGIGEIGAGILHPSMWHRSVAELSAGNQRRVQLALAVAAAPEILIVDEPTNYLDLDSIEALEKALADWNGTLLIASHDRWLLDHWTGERIELEPAGGELNPGCSDS
ncbi:ABC-F family ATP-binding cassette domain-containing protein [Actinomyces mediterranea]|uniref:ABC-F family ATP-binding cassette domain-containing protein n=1 Tax=Actinomyces mediterranea TaxID=1871028 RepID=UPI00097142CC|nr:ABC-F family ATP-binding cassette domain-containing protein [Actinomyces mediterranea]